MLTVVVSIVLTIATLAGVVLLIFSNSLLTVDGLFFTLILGFMSAIFAANSFHALRRLRALRVSAQQVKPTPAAQTDVTNSGKSSGSAPASAEQQDVASTPASASGTAPSAPPDDSAVKAPAHRSRTGAQ